MAVPVSTGATEAASVAGRTADHHTWVAVGRIAVVTIALRALRKLAEVRLSFLDVSVATFLRLFAHVEEQRCVARQLLDAGQTVVRGGEARLEQPQRERAEL